ncbi:hypothetical protein Smp_073990 [Schistosoma mansoni]|uniref:hypothetical protein n=1 Tax=Schistosoma mansoni TaxID=6183 RepID=UPI00022C8421|nr:hypothetical protein Smp_073990 [Schistosoma mansoni]|eukprot:XP_018646879.1 hypothetical protein Smp_073990 [Schistosoma mansoni]
MAKSIYEYVRNFETVDPCLPSTWIVVRLDGQSFHKFTTKHNFDKPNDTRGLLLSVRGAERVMQQQKEMFWLMVNQMSLVSYLSNVRKCLIGEQGKIIVVLLIGTTNFYIYVCL